MSKCCWGRPAVLLCGLPLRVVGPCADVSVLPVFCNITAEVGVTRDVWDFTAGIAHNLMTRRCFYFRDELRVNCRDIAERRVFYYYQPHLPVCRIKSEDDKCVSLLSYYSQFNSRDWKLSLLMSEMGHGPAPYPNPLHSCFSLPLFYWVMGEIRIKFLMENVF